MQYFPIFIDLENQPVIVVGGGETAAQKVRLLLKTNADITLIAPAFIAELEGFAAAGKLKLLAREFVPRDVKGARLVYAATGIETHDHAVSSAAQTLNIPVNVVDDQKASSFITPAIVDRSPVVVAISTEGAAPVLAREIKARLEAMLPAKFGALARFASSLRPLIAHKIATLPARRKFWETFFKGPARNHVLADNLNKARNLVDIGIKAANNNATQIGKISLVGVGPGDPDLLTLKAQQCLQEADVIVLDGLVNEEILEYARRDARRLYVGKTPGKSFIRQSEFVAEIARETLDGAHVVRLQGGDHLHLARDLAELKPLEALGINIETVPGVSSNRTTETLTQSGNRTPHRVVAKG